ncbi:hypothetical protein G7Y89_g11165 [Cudoniella acicularis]|uniref:Uncharacterized protein n=1 Tax=Cudoniella acicularis TaxID=354080 RepID=A0A8H4RF00_9HELO|nr:hypothetical protein G7Y89_g11165 [Cudoniella acicularis]
MNESPSPIGSEVFSVVALLGISLVVLLILRHYLPLRTTPAYLTVPIFFALGLPASIILLVPIDLASSSRDAGTASRGIWLPEPVLLVSWRISYWLTFGLTWFILPILEEYADAGYREPKGRLMYSLRANAQYQGIIFGAGIIGMIYFFISSGVSPGTLKGLIMALAYCWGLMLAIYLMGHGLVAIPRRLFRNANISGRLKRIQASAPKVHEKMEDAISNLEDLEAQVAELSSRKTGSAKIFKDWIEELAEESHIPESRPRTLARRMSAPQVNVPNVITERYLADLSRQLDRARHTRARYLDEWDRILQASTETQAILDSAASKRIELGEASPHSSIFDRFTVLTPYTRYLYKYYFLPYTRIFLGGFFSLASFCIIWSEVIKSINPYFSIIALTVVHHAESERGQIGFPGQVIASCWILYMCAAAFTSITEVKVWRGRALVRRNTHGESAMWYAMQVAKLSVPLAFNFLTFLLPDIYTKTVFFDFLGKYVTLTPLGTWFDWLFPAFILIPVCATLFNLYGKVKNCVGFGGVIDDDEENESGYGTGSWREGRDLIERELHGHSSLGRLGQSSSDRRSHVPNNPNNRSAPTMTVPPAETHRALGPAPTSRPSLDPQQRSQVEPEDENFFEAFGHRVKNTFETDPSYNSVEEHPLTPDEFENYLHRRGVFAPPILPVGVKRKACLRLILQQNAQHPETFTPHVISLKPEQYVSMVEALNLPYRSIESTSCVGPFFWSAWDQDEENPHLQIVYRKSDVRKKGFTRGWELTLSHDVNNGITTGFCKGTPSSDLVECIKHLKACVIQIGHPMLLPIIIFSHDVSFKTDIKQRDAREWLRRLEHAVSMRSEIEEREGYVKEGVVDLDAVNRDLVECHSQVLWKRPKAYLEILKCIEGAMVTFYEHLPVERKDKGMRALQASMLARMDFYRVKLQGIESYAYTTLQRLDIQRSALYNIIAQKESKLNFQMAGEQRKLAHASKRDSTAMKTISLLGAIFLPGAYLASVFSMTFFNFQGDGSPSVSKQFWIYWAVTIPITTIIVIGWWLWDRRREKRYEDEDQDLEKGSEGMEKTIMATMRKRTMSKASTWDTKKSE